MVQCSQVQVLGESGPRALEEAWGCWDPSKFLCGLGACAHLVRPERCPGPSQALLPNPEGFQGVLDTGGEAPLLLLLLLLHFGSSAE